MVDNQDLAMKQENGNGVRAIANSAKHAFSGLVGGAFGSMVGYSAGLTMNVMFSVSVNAFNGLTGPNAMAAAVSGPLVLPFTALGMGIGLMSGALISWLSEA